MTVSLCQNRTIGGTPFSPSPTKSDSGVSDPVTAARKRPGIHTTWAVFPGDVWLGALDQRESLRPNALDRGLPVAPWAQC